MTNRSTKWMKFRSNTRFKSCSMEMRWLPMHHPLLPEMAMPMHHLLLPEMIIREGTTNQSTTGYCSGFEPGQSLNAITVSCRVRTQSITATFELIPLPRTGLIPVAVSGLDTATFDLMVHWGLYHGFEPGTEIDTATIRLTRVSIPAPVALA